MYCHKIQLLLTVINVIARIHLSFTIGFSVINVIWYCLMTELRRVVQLLKDNVVLRVMLFQFCFVISILVQETKW